MKLVCFGIVFIGVCIQASPQCKHPDCTTPDCPSIPCLHGECDSEGLCVCSACWAGKSCNQQVNNAAPKFDSSSYEAKVTLPMSSEKPVLQVEANDDDAIKCGSTVDCPCAEIAYSIEAGNEENLFTINKVTGEIFVTGNTLTAHSSRFYLTLAAENPSFTGTRASRNLASAVITVSRSTDDLLGMKDYAGFQANYDNIGYSEAFPNSMFDEAKAHHRSKRDVNTDLSMYDPGVENVTFHLEKTDHYENVSSLVIGDKVHFLLAIQFPQNVETDMLVELFTPDNDTTVMTLCNVVVAHVGSNLNADGQSITPASFPVVMEAKTPDSYDYDRAIIDFGNITNDAGASVGTDEMVIVEWDAVLIANPETDDSQTYWVSAGAEYNDDTEIWVGQASFSVDMSEQTVSDEPTFNFSGPCEMQIGASTVFQLEMYLPYPSKHIYIDAFATLDDNAITVCSALVTGTGSQYSCLPKDHLNFDAFPGTDCNDKCNERVRLDLGTITNAGWNEAHDWEENLIRVEFMFHALNSSAVVDNDYTIHAAVQIGELAEEIWAGSLNVTIVDTIEAETVGDADPTFQFSTISDTDAVAQQAVVYELTMSIPENTEGVYYMEVLAPYNESQARMSICEVSVLKQGVNVPCFTDTEPEYLSRSGNHEMDRLTWDLGRIRNSGHRDSTIDPTANDIVFKVVASITNHTLNTLGELLWLTVGMDIDSERLWVGSNAVTIVDFNNHTNSSEVPEFSMNYTMGDGTVAVGASTNVTLTIGAQPNVIHTPMDIEIIMPFENNAAIARICKAEIIHIGKNMPCLDRETLNSSIEYDTRVNVTLLEASEQERLEQMDRAVLGFGPVCNIGHADATDPKDDEIQINYVVELMDHPNVTDGWVTRLSEGVHYANDYIWVGQIDLTATTAVQSYAGDDEPLVFVNIEDDNVTAGTMFIGHSVEIELIIKLPPSSTADLEIRAEVSTGLSVCNIRVAEIGHSFPCLTIEQFTGNYTMRTDDSYTNENGYIEMGPVSNVGASEVANNTDFDENTIRVMVVVQALETASEGSAQTIDVFVNHGGVTNQVDSTSVTLAISTPAVTVDSLENVTLTVAPVNENQVVSDAIAKGQTMLYHLDVYVPEGTNHDYTIKFLTPVSQSGVMELCSLAVVYVGPNLPCLRKEAYDDISDFRTDSTFVDFRTLDLGYVCQHNIEDTQGANLIRIEAAVRATRSSALVPDDQMWLSATVKLNEDQIYVAQLQLNITVTDDFVQTEYDNTTGGIALGNGMEDEVVTGTPGDLIDFPLILTVPPNSSLIGLLDVQTAVNTSAIFTAHHVEVNSSGINVGCMAGNHEIEFTATYTSEQDSSQTDNLRYDLGIVTNTGVTYKKNVFEEEDNNLWMLVQVQVADAIEVTNGSTHTVSFGLSLGSNVYILDKDVVIIRNNNEEPDIILEAEMVDNTTYGVGDRIVVEAFLKHTNLSRAEGYNTTASFYFPPFMRFVEVIYSNLSMPEVLNTTSGAGISFMFNQLFFTDIANFSFSLEVVADQEIPFEEQEVNSTTPYEAGSNIIYRENHDNDSGTWFVSRVDQLSYKITGPANTECVGAALGMENGDITDCQLSNTQAGAGDPDSTAQDARLNAGSGFDVGMRSGPFSPYIEVNFGNITRVISVRLQNSACNILGLDFKYSNDGILWKQMDSTAVVTASVATQDVTLPSMVEGRFVRMEIVSNDCTTATPLITVEFNGCSTGTGESVSDVCAMGARAWGQYATASELYYRGYLGTPSNLYYCDEHPKSGKTECFRSMTANGSTWKALDKVVMNVLGYESSEGELYGIAWDKRSFMMSPDMGDTWYSVARERFTEASGLGTWSGARSLPWHLSSSFSDGTTGSSDAFYDGVYNGSAERVATWGECCA